MSPAALSIAGVAHRYGDHEALKGVSFSVQPGERFALLGPNGSGKTTLLRIVTTLLRPSAGAAAVLGHDTQAEPRAAREALGVVFQHPALDRGLTAVENLKTHAALVGVPAAERAARVDQALKTVGVADRAHDRVGTLSGGLVRRADLARALLHRPAVLLLDEPTTGLDPTARRQFWVALDRLQGQHGTTVVVATHLMDEAEACDRVAILSEGALVALGEPGSLKAELGAETLWLSTDAPDELAHLIGQAFGASARVVGDRVLVEGETPASLVGPLYAAYGDRITAATVRPPTLDDVFAARTAAPALSATSARSPLAA